MSAEKMNALVTIAGADFHHHSLCHRSRNSRDKIVATAETKQTNRPRIAQSLAASSSTTHTSRKTSFVDKLHAILANKSYQSIISWLPSGMSFVIMDKTKFTIEVLTRNFRGIQFESFLRQLKRWGFRKVVALPGTAHAVYCHALFQRDRPDLRLGMNGRANQETERKGSRDAINSAKVEAAMFKQASRLVRAERDSSYLQVRSLKPAQATTQLLSYQMPTQINPAPTTMQNLTHSSIANNLVHMEPALSNRHSETFAGHSFQTNYIRPASVMNSAQQGNFACHHMASSVMRHVQSPMAMQRRSTDTDITRLDEEIASCEEQLAILNRLRVLRQMRGDGY